MKLEKPFLRTEFIKQMPLEKLDHLMNFKREQYILDNGREASEMDMENKSG